MNPHIGFVTLGVGDLNRAKQFYSEGLGWPVQVAQGQYVAFKPADGSSTLTLYPRSLLAGDAGVTPDGGGFRGVTFSYVVRSKERVDAVLAEAERAGGTIARPAAGTVGRLLRLLRRSRRQSLEGRGGRRGPAVRRIARGTPRPGPSALTTGVFTRE
jgi:uncharacterized protein